MQHLLLDLNTADYQFLVGLVQSPLNLTDDLKLSLLLKRFEATESEENREALCEALEDEIRYLGSHELAWFIRKVSGQQPGVPFRTILQDVAAALKIRLKAGTESDQLKELVQQYVSDEISRMPSEKQQEMLESLGVEREKALDFVLKGAGVFAVPALIQAFGSIVVDRLIKQVVFGTITRLIGRRVSAMLFGRLMARFPWWIRWVGPAAWTLSFGWAAMDLAGPALRKTIPVVLYLGVCRLRQD